MDEVRSSFQIVYQNLSLLIKQRQKEKWHVKRKGSKNELISCNTDIKKENCIARTYDCWVSTTGISTFSKS